jgi:hypothetical protein
MNEPREDKPNRDERLGALLRDLPTPGERESFWAKLDESIARDPSMSARRRHRRLRPGMPPLGVAVPAVALLCVALLAISRLGGGGGGDGSCADLVIWHGYQYSGNSVAKTLKLSPHPIGTGRRPACSDVPGVGGTSGQVDVYRIVGVPTSKAIAIRSELRTEFTRDGPS